MQSGKVNYGFSKIETVYTASVAEEGPTGDQFEDIRSDQLPVSHESAEDSQTLNFAEQYDKALHHTFRTNAWTSMRMFLPTLFIIALAMYLSTPTDTLRTEKYYADHVGWMMGKARYTSLTNIGYSSSPRECFVGSSSRVSPSAHVSSRETTSISMPIETVDLRGLVKNFDTT
ncbi:hypothetical protein TSTA_077480 [Talaromyces stipitatus ATCC 10500]|uniref:Uncharacterized protein n=1 Tax=Talaromyces stipitatus (strain ATCC 10500 / CBS 375.48 / QM 6759 / NRRL 1006) TaxID=441959 RepID=B8LW20_TALSN|nr:uncharacterized protein TSTA_077480 [Talaromyces stipitatus ATCC 10500]EED24386.1 hypothetical protein TSTA_077480 [Talaromyces stipitatus ATCC 10500]